MTLQEPKDKKRQIPVFVAKQKTVCLPGMSQDGSRIGRARSGSPFKKEWNTISI